MKKPLLIAVLGPTASGKTSLAIDIAKRVRAEIFSADSRQFYHELNIGVAKPSLKELSEILHHFIGHKSIHQEFSVGDFEREALRALDTYFSKHQIGVLVGGSGLFVHAVLEGLDEFPSIPQTLRDELNNQLALKGLDYLVDELAKVDPATVNTIDLKNPRRVLRALEVSLHSGKPFSSFKNRPQKPRPFDVLKLGIDWPRTDLYQRIDERCERMMDAGLFDEVKGLWEHRDLNALQTLGYREFFEVLKDQTTLPEAIETFKTKSRNYAKRQMTWLRKHQEIHWLKAPIVTQEVEKIIESVQ